MRTPATTTTRHRTSRLRRIKAPRVMSDSFRIALPRLSVRDRPAASNSPSVPPAFSGLNAFVPSCHRRGGGTPRHHCPTQRSASSSSRSGRVGLQQLASVQPEEQEKPGHDQQHGSGEHGDEHHECGVRRRAVRERQAGSGQERRVLPDTPSTYDRRDAERGERTQPPRSPERQQSEDDEAASRAEYQQRQRAAGEPAEERVVGMVELCEGGERRAPRRRRWRSRRGV
jgi:hypothetical protein